MKTKECYTHSTLIHVRKVSFCTTNSILLYNSVIEYFPIADTAFKVVALTLSSTTRGCCKQFHQREYSHFYQGEYRYYFYHYIAVFVHKFRHEKDLI